MDIQALNFIDKAEALSKEESFLSAPQEQRETALRRLTQDHIDTNSITNPDTIDLIKRTAQDINSFAKRGRRELTAEDISEAGIKIPSIFDAENKDDVLNQLEEARQTNKTARFKDFLNEEDLRFQTGRAINQMERQVRGEEKGRLTDTGNRIAQGFLSRVLRTVPGVSTEFVEDFEARNFPENPELDDTFFSKLSSGGGDFAASILTFLAGNAVAGPVGGFTASLGTNSVVRYKDSYNEVFAETGNEFMSNEAALRSLPASVVETLADKVVAGKFLGAQGTKSFKKAIAGKNPKEVATAIGKLVTDTKKRKALVEGFMAEGLGAVAGDTIADFGMVAATGDLNFTPTAKELFDAFTIEGILGGGVAVGGQSLSNTFNKTNKALRNNAKEINKLLKAGDTDGVINLFKEKIATQKEPKLTIQDASEKDNEVGPTDESENKIQVSQEGEVSTERNVAESEGNQESQTETGINESTGRVNATNENGEKIQVKPETVTAFDSLRNLRENTTKAEDLLTARQKLDEEKATPVEKRKATKARNAQQKQVDQLNIELNEQLPNRGRLIEEVNSVESQATPEQKGAFINLMDGLAMARTSQTGATLDSFYERFSVQQLEEGEETAGRLEGERLEKREQEVQATPEFNEFFQDSKVLNEDNSPKVLFHGTSKEFESFRLSDIGSHFGTEDQANSRIARRVFNDNEAKADPDNVLGLDFGKGRNSFTEGGRIIPVYLSIKNPVRIRDINSFDDPIFVGEELVRKGIITEQERLEAQRNPIITGGIVSEQANLRKLRNLLKEKGYDGIVYLNRHEGVKEDVNDLGDLEATTTDEAFKQRHPSAEDSYIVFESTQVKSIFNEGDFDTTNPDILKSEQESKLEGTAIAVDEEGNQFIPETNEDLQRSVSGLIGISKENGNISTYLHEAMHVLRVTGLVNEVLDSNELTALEEAAGVFLDDEGNAHWSRVETNSKGETTRNTEPEERLARSFEGWLRNPGQSQDKLDPILVRAFNKIKNWLQKIYANLRDSPLPSKKVKFKKEKGTRETPNIHPDFRATFEKLFNIDESFEAQQAQETTLDEQTQKEQVAEQPNIKLEETDKKPSSPPRLKTSDLERLLSIYEDALSTPEGIKSAIEDSARYAEENLNGRENATIETEEDLKRLLETTKSQLEARKVEKADETPSQLLSVKAQGLESRSEGQDTTPLTEVTEEQLRALEKHNNNNIKIIQGRRFNTRTNKGRKNTPVKTEQDRQVASLLREISHFKTGLEQLEEDSDIYYGILNNFVNSRLKSDDPEQRDKSVEARNQLLEIRKTAGQKWWEDKIEKIKDVDLSGFSFEEVGGTYSSAMKFISEQLGDRDIVKGKKKLKDSPYLQPNIELQGKINDLIKEAEEGTARLATLPEQVAGEQSHLSGIQESFVRLAAEQDFEQMNKEPESRQEMFEWFIAMDALITDGDFTNGHLLINKIISDWEAINDDFETEGFRDASGWFGKKLDSGKFVSKLSSNETNIRRLSRIKKNIDFLRDLSKELEGTGLNEYNNHSEKLKKWLQKHTEDTFGKNVNNVDLIIAGICSDCLQTHSDLDVSQRDAEMRQNYKGIKEGEEDRLQHGNQRENAQDILNIFERVFEDIDIDSVSHAELEETLRDRFPVHMGYIDGVVDYLSQYTDSYQFVTEFFHNRPFRRVDSFVPKDSVPVDPDASRDFRTKDKDGNLIIDGPVDDFIQHQSEQNIAFEFQPRTGQLGTGKQRTGRNKNYHYNLNIYSRVLKKSNQMLLDVYTTYGRKLWAARLRSKKLEKALGDKDRNTFLNNIAAKTINGQLQEFEYTPRFERAVQGVVRRIARPLLSSVHQYVSQPLAAFAHHAFRNPKALKFYGSAAKILLKVRRDTDINTLPEHQRAWKSILSSLYLRHPEGDILLSDPRNAKELTSLGGILNSSVTKSLKRLDKNIGKVLFNPIKVGDMFSADLMLVSEILQQLESSGVDVSSISEVDSRLITEEMITKANAMVDENVNVSRNSRRGEHFMRPKGWVALTMAFAGHRMNVATRTALEIRNLVEGTMKADGAAFKESVSFISAAIAQSAAFTLIRGGIAMVLAHQMANIMLSGAGEALAGVETDEEREDLEKVVDDFLQKRTSNRGLVASSVKDAFGNLVWFSAIGGADNFIFSGVDPFVKGAFEDYRDNIVDNLNNERKKARRLNDKERSNQLKTDIEIWENQKHIPLSHRGFSLLNLGGIVEAFAQPIENFSSEAVNSLVENKEFDYTEGINVLKSFGYGQTEINRFVGLLEKAQNKIFERRQREREKGEKAIKDSKKENPRTISIQDFIGN